MQVGTSDQVMQQQQGPCSDVIKNTTLQDNTLIANPRNMAVNQLQTNQCPGQCPVAISNKSRLPVSHMTEGSSISAQSCYEADSPTDSNRVGIMRCRFSREKLTDGPFCCFESKNSYHFLKITLIRRIYYCIYFVVGCLMIHPYSAT